eukprot:2466245-Amphidinium_carterae.1
MWSTYQTSGHTWLKLGNANRTVDIDIQVRLTAVPPRGRSPKQWTCNHLGCDECWEVPSHRDSLQD